MSGAIARRLRAMIVNLANTLPPTRHPALRRELDHLDKMLEKILFHSQRPRPGANPRLARPRRIDRNDGGEVGRMTMEPHHRNIHRSTKHQIHMTSCPRI